MTFKLRGHAWTSREGRIWFQRAQRQANDKQNLGSHWWDRRKGGVVEVKMQVQNQSAYLMWYYVFFFRVKNVRIQECIVDNVWLEIDDWNIGVINGNVVRCRGPGQALNPRLPPVHTRHVPQPRGQRETTLAETQKWIGLRFPVTYQHTTVKMWNPLMHVQICVDIFILHMHLLGFSLRFG